MNWLWRTAAWAALTLLSALPSAHGEDAWIQLFNGYDLTGWTPKIVGHAAGDNFADTFRVEDGLLKVRYDKYDGDFDGRFGHLFYDKPFSHYRIRVEYRFVGEQAPNAPAWAYRNNGIMIHGQTAESMGLDQSFPVSMEFQLLGGDGKKGAAQRQPLHARHASHERR